MPDRKYYAMTVPGLESLARVDIQSCLEDANLLDESPGKLVFSYSGTYEKLLRLRSVDNIFIHIGTISGITRSRNSLGEIFRQVSSFEMDDALRIHKEAHGGKGKKLLTFRVVSTMVGRHNFRRIDAQKAVEACLTKKHGWRFSLDSPTLEFRMDLDEDSVLLGLRLTDNRIHRKGYKVSHVPASLSPSAAYCMVLLSDPKPSDVFADPMCGAGTIIAERTMAGRYSRIIGGDIDAKAILSAQKNTGSGRLSPDLMRWDALRMPLGNHVIDKIVCNLPFGKQTEKLEHEYQYLDFFKESYRVLKPRGKMVILSSEPELTKNLKKSPYFSIERIIKIDLYGIRAYIYVLYRRNI